jgi:hypothetical protein
MVRPMRFSVLLLLAAACGNPDNVVVGGISATATIPVAFIDTVRSAIAGTTTVKDFNGNKIGQREAIILSNTKGLCDQLQAHHDYFQNPPEDFVAVVLLTPIDRVGTFFIGRDQGTDILIVPAAQGVKPQPYLGQATGTSYIALHEMSGSGGNAVGSFDVIVVDSSSGGHEFYGKFMTGSCAALNDASISLP